MNNLHCSYRICDSDIAGEDKLVVLILTTAPRSFLRVLDNCQVPLLIFKINSTQLFSCKGILTETKAVPYAELRAGLKLEKAFES